MHRTRRLLLLLLLPLPLLPLPAPPQSDRPDPSTPSQKPEQAAPAPDPEANLPPAASLRRVRGRELIHAHCLPCHSAAVIAATHLSRDQWDRLITTMQEQHGMWALPPTLRGRILDFLETTQSSRATPPDTARHSPWANPLYNPNPIW